MRSCFAGMQLPVVMLNHHRGFSSHTAAVNLRLQRKGVVMLEFSLNGKTVQLEIEADTPLLWVLREQLGLSGTKYGCGLGVCGACTVHLAGQPIRSCQTPVSAIAGQAVTTIEGISANGLHVVQQAWIEGNVPQCGYCQSGQIMSAVALLSQSPKPTDAQIDAAMSGNLCRCGMYGRIRFAIHRAAELQAALPGQSSPSVGAADSSGAVQLFDPKELLVRANNRSSKPVEELS